MRIRKRKVPFPLSSLSPIPLSDPQLHRSPVVQLHFDTDPRQNLLQEDDTAAYFNPPLPSDQPIGGNNQEEKKVLVEDRQIMKGEGEEEKSNDTRKGGVLGAQVQETLIFHQSSSSHQGGRWCEGEKAFPLKKRRGSFERRSNVEAMNMGKDMKMKTKMKTKMNKKCNMEENGNAYEEEEEEKKAKEGGGDGSSTVKKRARGGALMEGSRCSRVNGRGWRCCQQTLVGYSLCEHHLGKGRLRSMTSVRSRSMASVATKKVADPQLLSNTSLLIEEKETKPTIPDNKSNAEDDQDGGDEKKPLVIGKKKTKLGMVKARSISSLLGQGKNAISVAENDITSNV